MSEEIQDSAQSTEDNVEQAEETALAQEDTQEAEQTIAELSQDDEVVEKRVVDQNVFVAEKKARKAAERELAALRQSIEEGASQREISSEADSIAEEYDIDPNFMKRLVDTIKAETEQALDKKYSDKLSAKEKEEKFDTAFNKQFKVALDRGPEFEAVANQEVIKTLAKLPQNKNKTVSQLLEETYGNALTGKRTIETTQPAAGKEVEPLDLSRAENDISYFNEIMKDPKKKARYNENMLKRGF